MHNKENMMIVSRNDKDFVGEFFHGEGHPAIARLKNTLTSEALSAKMMEDILARDDEYLTF